MCNCVTTYLLNFWRDESGQSITEYGAIIAFVGLLVAMAFSMAKGSLFATVSGSYSSCVSNLDQLNRYQH